MKRIEIETPHGLVRAHVDPAKGASAALVLGHGAGGSVDAPDLAAASKAAASVGLAVALVEQPYKVAGRKSPAPAGQLDTAWIAVIAHLRSGALEGLAIIAGGRSAGARVACRTAEATGAAAVLCLAFPVHPPGKPEKTRIDELDAVEVPVLVVQGESDPFGMPGGRKGCEVAVVAGNHGLKKDLEAVERAVAAWLPGAVGASEA